MVIIKTNYMLIPKFFPFYKWEWVLCLIQEAKTSA